MKTILALEGSGLTERDDKATVVAVGAAAADVQADWWVVVDPEQAADVKPKGKPKTWAPLGSGIETRYGFAANAECKANPSVAAAVLLGMLGVGSVTVYGLDKLSKVELPNFKRALRSSGVALIEGKATKKRKS